MEAHHAQALGSSALISLQHKMGLAGHGLGSPQARSQKQAEKLLTAVPWASDILVSLSLVPQGLHNGMVGLIARCLLIAKQPTTERSQSARAFMA